MALEHHPDVSKEPSAESEFQEINTAYQVLKDPATRAEYDASRDTRTSLTRQSTQGDYREVRRYYFQRRIRAATDPGSTRNYYDVLGVPRNATEETIARAFQRLYGEFYPGRNVDPATETILREFLEARDLLMDPDKRAAYDGVASDRQALGRPRGQMSGDQGRETSSWRTLAIHRRAIGRLAVTLGLPLLALAVGAVVVLAR